MTQKPIPQPVHPNQLDVDALVGNTEPKYDQVPVAPESRLDQLLAAYAVAKPEADAAAERLKALKSQIEYELAAAAPAGSTGMEVRSPSGVHLRYVHSTSTRLDTAKLRRDIDPAVLAPYTKQSESWSLRVVGGV